MSTEYELRFLRAGLLILEDYLLAADLYWPIGIRPAAGETPYPQFTLGGLLFYQRTAQSRSATPEQSAELAQLSAQIETIRSKWRVAWNKKAAVDFKARLKLWTTFLEEYRSHPEFNADRYAYEVTRRVQLHLLKSEAEEMPKAEIDLLTALDKVIGAALQPGGFIWDKELESGFPQDQYWYLYGQLKKSKSI